MSEHDELPTIAVRLMGGPLDGMVCQIGVIGDRVPAARISFPVAAEIAESGWVHYRPTGHMWNAPGEPGAYLYVIDIEPTEADLATGRPISAERMAELRAGSETTPSPAEHQSTALDPGLAAYLDWPLYFPDDSVHCDKFPACPNRDCCDPESGRVYIASARRMTVREFLADIKAHAGSGASDQSG